MIDRSKVLSFVREKGPVLPRDVAKAFGGDTFFTGAMLSTLVDSKEIKISHAKIGGSPVYYFQGQEEKLNLLYKFLPGKEKEAYDRLKSEKVMRDSETEPAIRVALRSIKDFAKAFEVDFSNNKEIFWKWYLTPNSEAESIIRQAIAPVQVVKEEKKEEQRVEAEPVSEQPKAEPPAPSNAAVEDKPQPKKQAVQERLVEKKQEIKEQPKEQIKEEKGDELLQKVKKIFAKHEVIILETNIIRRNSDIEMIIRIPSCLGSLKYFCKIRDKKKSNDKDLSSVYVQGQMKKLPVLYITTGEITKKAQDMMEMDFSTVSVMHI